MYRGTPVGETLKDRVETENASEGEGQGQELLTQNGKLGLFTREEHTHLIRKKGGVGCWVGFLKSLRSLEMFPCRHQIEAINTRVFLVRSVLATREG